MGRVSLVLSREIMVLSREIMVLSRESVVVTPCFYSSELSTDPHLDRGGGGRAGLPAIAASCPYLTTKP